MLKILLVDDDSEKIKKICSVINEFGDINQNSVDTALHLVGARQLLSSKQYDLMILDINLPNRLGEDNIDDGGVQFLKELSASTRLKKPFHIIGITSHKDLASRHLEDFNDDLWSLIHYQEQYNAWETKIKNKISYLINSKKVIIDSIINANEYDFDIAIITALHKPELKSVLAIDAGWTTHKAPNDDTTYYRGVFKNNEKELRVVAASAPQMGMSAATLLSMKLINNFRPKYLIMTGIAAGVKDVGNLGDVLIADQSWDYGSGKNKYIPEEKISVFEPDGRFIPIETSLKEKLSKDYRRLLFEIQEKWPIEVNTRSNLQTIIGPLASGAMVLANHQIIDDIKTHQRKLIGIDMETYGVYYAATHCTEPRPKFVSIKSICDFADHEKNDGYQDYASYTSAQFTYRFALEEL